MAKSEPGLATLIPAPLDLGEWCAQTTALGQGAADGEWVEQGECLREAFALLTLAPRGLGAWLNELPARSRFDTMLAAGCWESAALALLPEEAAWMVSRAAEGDCMASVLLPGETDEATSHGASPALALVAALAAALVCASPAPPLRLSAEAIDLRRLPRPAGWLH